jgi:agmatine deiminase
MSGWRMPAEWEPHEAIWLSWPYDRDSFGEALPEAENACVRIVAEIHKTERVELFVRGPAMRRRAESTLEAAGVDRSRVRLRAADYADVWIRDYGPTFVLREGRLGMVRWIFNAWGGKYAELLKDGQVFDSVEREMNVPCVRPGVVMEGGSFDVDGRGTLLTTEQCLLNKNRNPALGRSGVERVLKESLGVKKVLWLKDGVAGDDTDGHVDDIARFVAPGVVACAVEDRACDENYAALKENCEALGRMADAEGRPLNVLRLPMPEPLANADGRLPASYANFYIGNGVVLAPVFGCRQDEKALQALEKAFPGRRIAPIPCRGLVYGLGTVHCASQQQPASAQSA